MTRPRNMRIAGLLLIALLLAACGSGTETAAETGEPDSSEDVQTIAVFIPNGGDPYFHNKSYGYYLADEELADFDVEVFDAGSYSNIERQIRQVEDAIQRGVAAIVLMPVDSSALCGTAQEAMDAGIVVVSDDIMLNCDFTVPVGVSENSIQVGYNQCAYLAEQVGTGGIALMKGPSGAGVAQDRAQGCHEALAEYPDIELLDEQWGGSNIETGTTLMEDFLSAYGDRLNAVYAFGSVTAMGAANAAQAAGYNPGDIHLVGIDFHPEALAYVESGWIDGLIPAQPVYVARYAVLSAAALVNGGSVDGETGVDDCCEVRIYTADDDVLDSDAIGSYDPSPAVAPEDWSPNFRN
jgi:ABC-type sugar transport system substrate-binding protein